MCSKLVCGKVSRVSFCLTLLTLLLLHTYSTDLTYFTPHKGTFKGHSATRYDTIQYFLRFPADWGRRGAHMGRERGEESTVSAIFDRRRGKRKGKAREEEWPPRVLRIICSFQTMCRQESARHDSDHSGLYKPPSLAPSVHLIHRFFAVNKPASSPNTSRKWKVEEEESGASCQPPMLSTSGDHTT